MGAWAVEVKGLQRVVATMGRQRHPDSQRGSMRLQRGTLTT